MTSLQALICCLESDHSEPLSMVPCQCQPIRNGHGCISHLYRRQMVGTSSITAFKTVVCDPIWHHITQCSGHREAAIAKLLNLQPITKHSETQTCNEPRMLVLSSAARFNFTVALVLSTQCTRTAHAVTPQCWQMLLKHFGLGSRLLCVKMSNGFSYFF